MFTFILAVTEVNVYLVLKFFVFVGNKAGNLPKYLEFRRLLAWMFIDNPHMPVNEDPYYDPFLAGARCHDIGSAPPYASAYVTRKWICDNKTKYAQYTCKWPGCKKSADLLCMLPGCVDVPFAHCPARCGCHQT